MGIWTTIATTKQVPEVAAFGASDLAILQGSGAASPRSREQILKLYDSHPWIRLGGDIIAARQAAAEWFLLLPRGARGRSAARKIASVKSWRRAEARAAAVKAGDVEEIADHPFLNMMAQGTAGAPPWMELSGYAVDALERLTIDLAGEWVQVLIRDPLLGIPLRWWPAPPTWIDPPNPRRATFELRIRGRQPQQIPAEDIWWFRNPSPAAPYGRGASIGGALESELQQDEHLSAYLNALLRNRARPDLLVTLPGLNDIERERIEERWMEATTGVKRSGVTLFLGMPLPPAGSGRGAGGAGFHQLQQTPADLQSGQSRKDLRDAFLQVWRVPPSVAGITENSNRAVSFTGELHIRNSRTIPDLESRRNALQMRFFEPRGTMPPEYEGGWVLDYRLPPLEDTETLTDLMKTSPASFSENDFRRAAGLHPTDGGGQRRFLPSSVSVVSEAELDRVPAE